MVFHFALNRSSVEGDLAAGILWVTLLFAAILGVNRLFVADAEQGGFDGFLLAPGRPQRDAAWRRRSTLLAYLVVLEIVAVPAFALLLLAPPLRQALPDLLAACSRSPTSAWRSSARSSAALAVQTRARDLLGPLLGAAAAGADRDRRRPRELAAAGAPATRGAAAARWLADARRSMI